MQKGVISNPLVWGKIEGIGFNKSKRQVCVHVRVCVCVYGGWVGKQQWETLKMCVWSAIPAAKKNRTLIDTGICLRCCETSDVVKPHLWPTTQANLQKSSLFQPAKLKNATIEKAGFVCWRIPLRIISCALSIHFSNNSPGEEHPHPHPIPTPTPHPHPHPPPHPHPHPPARTLIPPHTRTQAYTQSYQPRVMAACGPPCGAKMVGKGPAGEKVEGVSNWNTQCNDTCKQERWSKARSAHRSIAKGRGRCVENYGAWCNPWPIMEHC